MISKAHEPTEPDHINAIDPFLSIKDTGGANGEDDVNLWSVLACKRFDYELPHNDGLAKKHCLVHVIQHILIDTYQNLHIKWSCRVADGSMQCPYEHIPFSQTDHNSYKHATDGQITGHNRRVKESFLLKFRDKAGMMLTKAQKRATINHKIVRQIIKVKDEDLVDLESYMDEQKD